MAGIKRPDVVFFIIAVILAALSLLIDGCSFGSTAVFIEPGKAVQLAEKVRGVAVWVRGTDGKVHRLRADLPAGAFVLNKPTTE